MHKVWLQRGVLQILVVRRKEEKRRHGNTDTRRSGEGHDTVRNNKMKNDDKKLSRERKLRTYLQCMHHK